MSDRLAQARAAVRQAKIDLQAYMSGPEGQEIKSYKDGRERVRDLVYDGRVHPTERVFDDDVRKSYDWLLKRQLETAPYRVKAQRLKDAERHAEQTLRAVEREVKNAWSGASEW